MRHGISSSEFVSDEEYHLSVDDKTHRGAQMRALELGTSVPALVRGYLRSLADEQSSGRGIWGRVSVQGFG